MVLSEAPPQGPYGLTPITPCRLFDTRNTTGPDAAASSLVPGIVRTLDAMGRCGIPTTAKALSVNVTATGAPSDGFVKIYRGDLNTVPVPWVVAFKAGATRAGIATVHLALDGSLRIRATSDTPVDVIVDVNGTFH